MESCSSRMSKAPDFRARSNNAACRSEKSTRSWCRLERAPSTTAPCAMPLAAWPPSAAGIIAGLIAVCAIEPSWFRLPTPFDDDVIVVEGLSTVREGPILFRMRFEKVWVEQCRATSAIKRRFSPKSALDYLIGEKLMTFADAARDEPIFAKELPRFLAAIWRVFNEFEIAGYVASRKPATRRRLRQLLYLR